MRKIQVHLTVALILLGIGSAAYGGEEPGERPVCQGLLGGELGHRVSSLEEKFPGISLELFSATSSVSRDSDKLDFHGFDEIYKNLKVIEDRVYPRGSWLHKIENLVRDVEDEFILEQVDARLARVRLAGIVYEAAVAANIPSEEIFIEEDLSKIAHNFRAERVSGKLEPLKHKRIDLAWFESGRLNVVEAKNISPKVFNESDTDLLDWLCLKIIRQSNSLVQAIKAYGVPITTFIIGRSLPVSLEEHLEALGATYDHYLEYDPAAGKRLHL